MSPRLGVLAALFTLAACDPFRTDFDATQDAQPYIAEVLTEAPPPEGQLRVMTWNVKFGAARIDFFFDCHGDRGHMKAAEVRGNLSQLAAHLRKADPDLIVLNEVDVGSRRSSYVDQVQYLLDHTDLNYGVYAAVWRVDFVPSDGIGRMDMGNAILARWPIRDARRVALPPIGDQDALTQYFYLQRNLLQGTLDLPAGLPSVRVIATHTAAFSQDGTKRAHIDRFKKALDDADDEGAIVLGGGDLNTLPPGSDQVRSFSDSACDERFEADDYSEEGEWLAPLYDRYASGVDLAAYQANNAPHFTHTTDADGFWNRKLDYLFTNTRFSEGRTDQDTMDLSDHAPVSALLELSP